MNSPPTCTRRSHATRSGRRELRFICLSLLGAMLVLAGPASAAAAPRAVVAGPTWPAPMRVGMARTVRAGTAPATRRKWCDYAAHTQRLQPLPVSQDPVFRRPKAAARERLRGLVETVIKLAPKQPIAPATQAAMATLLATEDGPSLARISLQHKDWRVRLLAAKATEAIVERYPRLAGFALEKIPGTDPDLAIAVVRCLMAARCDTPAIHATDGLEHADRRVRAATIDAILRSAAGWADKGVMGLLLTHATVEPDPLLRATIARGIGELGWLPADPVLELLLKDGDMRVRGEALVALAGIRRQVGVALLRKALKSKDVQMRAAAVRAVPLAMTERVAEGRKMLLGMVGDRGRVVDPLGVSDASTVGGLARLGLLIL